MMYTVMSIASIALVAFVAFGLSLLIVLAVANVKAAKQGREKGGEQQKPPPRFPDDAHFKRGA